MSPAIRGRFIMKTVPCPLCDGNRLSLYARVNHRNAMHSISQCDDCQMVFTNPPAPPQEFLCLEEEKPENAPEVLDLSSSYVEASTHDSRFLLDLIQPYKQGNRLLDFGCGNGVLVKVAREGGWQAEGYDLQAWMVKEANVRWGFNALHSGSLEDFVFARRGAFDVVTAFQVFEHVLRPVDVGLQLLQLLEPGGIFVVDVPHLHQLGEWFRRGKTLHPTSQCNHFSVATASYFLQRLGCEVIYKSAAPSFVGVYRRVGLKALAANKLGILTKKWLPSLGTGVCVIGRKSPR